LPDPISIQLYTLRGLGDLDLILDTVAHAGYRNVEGTGAHLDDAPAVAARLASRGLAMPSCHVGMLALRDRPDAIAAACHRLGCTDLYMPAVPPEQRRIDAAGWRALGGELAALSERFARAGISFGYHNHDWDLAPKEGASTALDLIFEEAAESPLKWQADVAWLVRANVAPGAWLARHAARLASAHVKDIAPAGRNPEQDGWADVGAGVLDWKSLWTLCRSKGARWMVVEHDKPADPGATARASLAWLRANVE
jgi:sugar phosphate isomerase/epimerase